MKHFIDYTCKNCGKIFKDYSANKRIYCSMWCRSHMINYGKTFSKEYRENISKALIGRKLTKEHCLNMSLSHPRPELVRKNCKWCNKEFIIKKPIKVKVWKNKKEKMFCSRPCRDKHYAKERKGILRPNFIPYNRGVRGVSKEISIKMSLGGKGRTPWNKGKHHIKISGKKSHLWKGGITPINEKIRTSLEYKLWRKSCFIRDNFTDAKTGIQGGSLVVHHINNFADFPELRTSPENGITLSKESHKEFHKIYGKHNNTREQLEKFLSVTV